MAIESIHVMNTLAESATFSRERLEQSACVVLDILRATSTMSEAIALGAKGVYPVAEIQDALEIRQKDPEVLLAGERGGLRIGYSLEDGSGFDLGNSPREFTAERVKDRWVAMTTTNGTRAINNCRRAPILLVASFLNLSSTAEWLLEQDPRFVCIVCSGTLDTAAFEDILGAGALCEKLCPVADPQFFTDSALLALTMWQNERYGLVEGLRKGRNGKRIAALPELAEDIDFCGQIDRWKHVIGCKNPETEGRLEITQF